MGTPPAPVYFAGNTSTRHATFPRYGRSAFLNRSGPTTRRFLDATSAARTVAPTCRVGLAGHDHAKFFLYAGRAPHKCLVQFDTNFSYGGKDNEGGHTHHPASSSYT